MLAFNLSDGQTWAPSPDFPLTISGSSCIYHHLCPYKLYDHFCSMCEWIFVFRFNPWHTAADWHVIHILKTSSFCIRAQTFVALAFEANNYRWGKELFDLLLVFGGTTVTQLVFTVAVILSKLDWCFVVTIWSFYIFLYRYCTRYCVCVCVFVRGGGGSGIFLLSCCV